MKEKMKFVPLNLIFCITSFLFPFFAMSTLIVVDTKLNLFISLYIYFSDVIASSKHDYLDDKIEKIKKELPKAK